MRRNLLLLAIAAVAVGASATALVLVFTDDDAADGRRVLTVTGRSEHRVEPDVATVRFGVTARALTARSAMRATSDSLDSVIAAVRRADVLEIRTLPARLRHVPRADEDIGRPIPSYRPFEASQAIVVRVAELDELGRLLDAGVEAGADDVSGPRFALADPGAARRRAVARAVTEARRTARTMAEAAGLRLGPALRVNERGGAYPVPATRAEVPAGAGTGPPIEPGKLTVTAAVAVTFAAEPA